jgi:hypothetical protein
MSKVFEDEFTEAQSSLIALCLEAVEGVGGIEELFVFGSASATALFFNVFFKQSGAIKSLGEVGLDDDAQFELLEIGTTEDMSKIKEICERYGRELPYVMKLHYVVSSGGLDAKYRYKIPADDNLDRDVTEDFLEWREEEKAE